MTERLKHPSSTHKLNTTVCAEGHSSSTGALARLVEGFKHVAFVAALLDGSEPVLVDDEGVGAILHQQRNLHTQCRHQRHECCAAVTKEGRQCVAPAHTIAHTHACPHTGTHTQQEGRRETPTSSPAAAAYISGVLPCTSVSMRGTTYRHAVVLSSWSWSWSCDYAGVVDVHASCTKALRPDSVARTCAVGAST